MESALRDVTIGRDSTQQLASAATQGATQQRNAFDMLRSQDPAASVGRLGGQAITMAPFMGAGEAAAGSALEWLGAAVPEVSPALRFLSGGEGASLPSRIASSAVAGSAQGAGAGLLTNATSDAPISDTVAKGAQFGALAGGAGPVAKAAGAKVAEGIIGPEIPSPIADLARKAMDEYKIPLRTSQIAGTVDEETRYRDSSMLGQAATGFAKNAAAQRTAFTRAVAKTFGADSASITPPVMSQARSALGAQFDDFARAHSITNADDVLTKVGSIIHDAQQSMPASEVAPLLKQVENIGSVIEPGAQGGPGSISGETYQRLTAKGSPLDRAMQSGDSNLRYYAGQIRSALDDGIAQSATPAERAAFSDLRLKYKNLMTIKGLAAKAGITGEISPVQLQGVVNRSFDDRAFTGAGPLGELADIGQTFMKEPPQSGTVPRIKDLIKSHMLGIGLGTGAVGESVLHDPLMTAKLAGAAGLATAGRLTGEALSGRFNNSNLRTRLMLGGREAIPVPPILRNAGVKLNELIGPTVAPTSALAGVQLTRPQDTAP
jgi:hypothetical protein